MTDIILEGVLDKKLSRPWGAQWVSRGVRLRTTCFEVESLKGGGSSAVERDESSRRYKLNEIQILRVQGPKEKPYAFAIASIDDPTDIKLTLCANTKFEHKRWIDSFSETKKILQEKRSRRRTAVARPSEDNVARRPLSLANQKSRRDLLTRKKDSLTSSDSSSEKHLHIIEEENIQPKPKPERTHASFEITAFEPRLVKLKPPNIVAESTLSGVVQGDELVGVGSTLFLNEPDGIETGAPISYGTAQINAKLQTAKYPVVLVFRRRYIARHIATPPETISTSSPFKKVNKSPIKQKTPSEPKRIVRKSPPKKDEKEQDFFPVIEAKSRRLTMAEEEILSEAQLEPVPEPDLELAKYERMLKVGAPPPAVLLKVRNELGDDAAQRFEARMHSKETTGLPPPHTIIKSTEEKATTQVPRKDEFEKYVRQSRRGVPSEAVFKKAKAEGLNAKQLEELAVRLGLPMAQVAELHHPSHTTENKRQLKYKGVHWEPQDVNEKRGSLWHRKTKDRRESMGARAETIFDNEEALDFLDTVMSANAGRKSPTVARSLKQAPEDIGSTPSKKRTEKGGIIEVLDHQRALSLQIALNQVRKDLQLRTASERALCIVIVASSEDVSPDATRALLAALPTPEEFNILKERTQHDAEDQRYTPATKFSLAVLHFFQSQALFASILSASLTLSEVEDEAAGACDRARAVARACRLIRRSKELRAALLSALTLGNKLNSDTRRGNAYAIKLLDLERLDHTRGKNGMTAFDVLAKVMHIDKARGDQGLDAESIDAELRALVPLLQETDAGPDHTFDVGKTLKVQVQQLRQNFLAEAQHIESSDDENDPASNARAKFIQRCHSNILGLDAAIAALDAVLAHLFLQQSKLAEYCSDTETPTKLIFDALLTFCKKLITARQTLLNNQQQLP